MLSPYLSGFILLTPTLKSRINNYFLMPFAWQNAKILFNSPPFLLSDFHCLFLIFHKSAQALFLTSCNPNKVLIARTALHQLSVLYHPLIKQRPPRLLFFLSRKLFYLSGFILLTLRNQRQKAVTMCYCPVYRALSS